MRAEGEGAHQPCQLRMERQARGRGRGRSVHRGGLPQKGHRPADHFGLSEHESTSPPKDLAWRLLKLLGTGLGKATMLQAACLKPYALLNSSTNLLLAAMQTYAALTPKERG